MGPPEQSGVHPSGPPIAEGTEYTPSVRDLTDQFAASTDVTSFDLVNALLDTHPQYFAGAARTYRVTPTTNAPHHPFAEWWREILGLFRPGLPRLLDGRLVILALTTLDDGLRRAFAPGMLERLDIESRAERRDPTPFVDLLTPEARERDAGRVAAEPVGQVSRGGDNVDLIGDQPARTDELGRRAFVEALAIRIRKAWKNDLEVKGGNFMVHIHGPWGSGKTTIINLLQEELETNDPSQGKRPWSTVVFNAWQHQRIAPPWWWLMSALYKEGRRRHPVRFRLLDYLWRLRVGFSPYLSLFVAAVVLLAAGWLTGFLPRLFATSLASMDSGARAVSDVIALLSAVAALVLGLSRLVTLGSANAASNFLETARDPMAQITHHYVDLARRLNPVAIFIDDLDRCSPEYVVQLLEGIQTLYGMAPAVYVVVAERRWLQCCFENIYQRFAGSVTEPGRPLGGLFLEKTFQLSTTVPRMPSTVRKAFWQRLLVHGEARAQQELEDARRQARLAVEGQPKAMVEEMMHNAPQGSAAEQALREAAVVRFAQDDVTEETERMLADFAPLLEPNPRAMKRLVNAFGVQRDMAVYAEADIPEKELALWTIASLRWPLLTDQLEKNPQLVDNILVEQAPMEADLAALRPLFTDPDVQRVFQGTGIGVKLNRETIALLAGMRTSDASAAGIA